MTKRPMEGFMNMLYTIERWCYMKCTKAREASCAYGCGVFVVS